LTWSADELAFDRALSFGERLPYTPSLDVESLKDFMPAVPSGSTGRTATVMENLSILGTADHVGTSPGFHGQRYERELQRMGVRFFADTNDVTMTEEYIRSKVAGRRAAKARAAVADAEAAGEQPPTLEAEPLKTEPFIRGAEDSVKQVILQRAVEGRHEKPVFAEDPAGVARARHLRSGTYRQKDVEIFEDTLNSLLASAKPTKQKKAQKSAQ
jgi:hypothetical protein